MRRDSGISDVFSFMGSNTAEEEIEESPPGHWWVFHQRPKGGVVRHTPQIDLFPHGLTLASFAVFGAPVIFGIHLAWDPNVAYWIGPMGYATILVPALLVMCHFAHLRVGRPTQLVTIFGTVVPSIILLLVANLHMGQMSAMGSQLTSSDCTTYGKKLEMERSWAAAAILYHDCLVRTSRENDVTFKDAMQLFRLQECTEYQATPDNYTQHRDTWNYLARLEEEEQCSGWCAESPPLWTFKPVSDSCAATAGTILRVKIIAQASRMMAYSITLLVLSIAGVFYTGASIRKRGLDW